MMTLRDSWEWDVCAGSLLITEAGGIVLDRHLAPPAFNTKRKATSGIIAGTPEVVNLIGTNLNL